MDDGTLYKETISSARTEALFVMLALLFLLLSAWRLRTRGLGFLAIAFFVLCAFFVFYSFNYRTLTILMDPHALVLRFGLFSWTVSLDSIEDAFLDKTPLVRIGGAGIHFTVINRRYRAYLNFLEFPRVVLSLKKPRWLVRDVAFTTQRPAEVLHVIDRMRRQGAAKAPYGS